MLVSEDAMDAAAAHAQFTGVVSISTGDEPAFARCYGYANRALQVVNTRETRFAVASGSKAFTALAVMRLVEEGAVALSDPVRPILGDDLPLIDDGVTLEQLLSHTSGIGDYLDEDSDWEASDYVLPVPVHTLAETEAFVAVVDGFPQAFPPGERFAYCNGGYIVLAVVAQRVSGVPFHELVDREVCTRAGLTGTSYLRSDDLPGDTALGYLLGAGNRTNVLHLPVRGNGDGGIYTTGQDLHRFWLALTNGRIVAPETMSQMIRPRSDVPDEGLFYGMGFYVHPTEPKIIIEGYDAGVSFRSTHDRSTRTTVSVLGNSSEGAWRVIAALA